MLLCKKVLHYLVKTLENFTRKGMSFEALKDKKVRSRHYYPGEIHALLLLVATIFPCKCMALIDCSFCIGIATLVFQRGGRSREAGVSRVVT